MNIDLSKNEIELLDKAMLAWERECQTNATMAVMLSAVLCPKEMREQEEANRSVELGKAEKESQQRRMQSTLLRAKLFQAMNRASEHEVEPIAS